MDTRRPSGCSGPNCPGAGHSIFGGMPVQHRPVQRAPQRQQQQLKQPQKFPTAGQTHATHAAKPKAAPLQTTQIPARTGVHLSAYVKDCTVAAQEGHAVIPLCMHRAEGRFAMEEGAARVPEDGYYMILWEMGTAACGGAAALHLIINEAAVPLMHQLNPGYESGQQITWLNAGDKLSLAVDASECAEVTCSGTQLTIIRMG